LKCSLRIFLSSSLTLKIFLQYSSAGKKLEKCQKIGFFRDWLTPWVPTVRQISRFLTLFLLFFCVGRHHHLHRHRMYKFFYMLIVTNVSSLVTNMSLEHEKWSKNRPSGEGSKTGVLGVPSLLRLVPYLGQKIFFSVLVC
jgi:hypothetical protein